MRPPPPLSDRSHPPVEVIAHPAERRHGVSPTPAQTGSCCCCCCCCLHTIGGLIGAAVFPNFGSAPEPDASTGQTPSNPLFPPLVHFWDEEYFDPEPPNQARTEQRGIRAEAPPRDAPTTSADIYSGTPVEVTPQTPPVPVPPVLPLPSHDREIRLARSVVRGPSAVRLFWRISGLVAIIVVLLAPMTGEILIGPALLLMLLPIFQLVAAVVTAAVLGASSRPDKGYQFRQLGLITLGLVLGAALGIGVMWAIAVSL